LATASGFSGSILFQPIFYFTASIPLNVSIATGIATEAVGMTNGTATYLGMSRKYKEPTVSFHAVIRILPQMVVGILIGLIAFSEMPRNALRIGLGAVMVFIGIFQLSNQSTSSQHGSAENYKFLRKPVMLFYQLIAGAFSACTGTGVAELSQPMLEKGVLLTQVRANATAICLEAIADLIITMANLELGNLRFDVLIYTVCGVLVGGQIGPRLTRYVHGSLVRIVYCVTVIAIGVFYISTSLSF